MTSLLIQNKPFNWFEITAIIILIIIFTMFYLDL